MDTKTISNKEDSAILAYIKHAMYHYYIFLSKKTRIYKRYNILESALLYDNENIFENLIVYNDDHSSLIWKDIRSCLTNKEFIILYHLLVLGENGQDVAKQMGITRQAVYNLKKAALNKLRKNSPYKNNSRLLFSSISLRLSVLPFRWVLFRST